MFRIEAEGRVTSPAAEVSAFLANVENEPKWQTGIVHVALTAGTVGRVGVVHERVQQFMGRNIKTSVELVKHEPAKRVELKATGKVIDYTVEYRLTPGAGAVTVQVRLEGEMKGFASMFESAVAEGMQAEIPASLQRLAPALEKQASKG